MGCDMPEPCKFPSLDSCQKRFPWTHKEADLAPHPAVGLVLQVGDAEKSPQIFGFKSLDPFFQGQRARSVFYSHTGRMEVTEKEENVAKRKRWEHKAEDTVSSTPWM